MPSPSRKISPSWPEKCAPLQCKGLGPVNVQHSAGDINPVGAGDHARSSPSGKGRPQYTTSGKRVRGRQAVFARGSSKRKVCILLDGRGQR